MARKDGPSKKDIQNLIGKGWTERREAQKEKNARASEYTKNWKDKQALAEQLEKELGRPLSSREYLELSGMQKLDMKSLRWVDELKKNKVKPAGTASDWRYKG